MKRNDQLKTDSHIGIIVKIIKFTIKLLTHSVKHTEADGERNRQFSAPLKVMFVVLGEPQMSCIWQQTNKNTP